jgi:uncharacterized SAM-dependent methyltransferase
MESWSEHSRAGLVKVLASDQFSCLKKFNLNILRHVFFCFGQEFFSRFYEFLKNVALENKKFLNPSNWLKISHFSQIPMNNLALVRLLKHFENFCKFSIFQIIFCLIFDPRKDAVMDILQTRFFYGCVIGVY